MSTRISVIIPHYNGEKTIGLCLEAVCNSRYDDFEVIVVDDCSSDNSVALIEQFPCRIIRLQSHSGAAVARNKGAAAASGDLLLFTDADCLIGRNTLRHIEREAAIRGPEVILGGSYDPIPYDRNFFSTFQSLFIHHFELKSLTNPDYIATHAMVINRETFSRSGGFAVDFLPLIEDVEFSHHAKTMGCKLEMDPAFLVQHVFMFETIFDSLKNCARKSRYWTLYSLGNRDIFVDSGTASFELKINVLIHFVILGLLPVYAFHPTGILLLSITVLFACNLALQSRLFSLFAEKAGWRFCIAASLYYLFLYPFAVAVGAAAGLLQFMTRTETGGRSKK